MAATAEAERLTEAHRLAQARLGAQTAARIRAAWRLLDPSDLDGTTGRWLRVAVPIVQAQHGVSAALAANYVRTFRTLELGTGEFAPVLARTVDPRRVATSLVVTGPVGIKAGMSRGQGLAQVIDIAEARSARAAMRHVLDGGRETVLGSVESDKNALGWARSTSGSPCSFCALLASRGPVFKKGSFDRSDVRFSGRGTAKVHDGCFCGVEPVYRRDASWPSGTERYRDLYREAAQGERDPLNAFRRAYESQ